MCNLSDGILEYGIEQGKAEGTIELLKRMIADRIKNNESDETILNELKRYGATLELIKKIHDELCSMA